jgi:hypothetical protein
MITPNTMASLILIEKINLESIKLKRARIIKSPRTKNRKLSEVKKGEG